MQIRLHKNATATSAVRAAIQQASGTLTDLAEQFHVSPRTLARWKARDGVHDASHTPHWLQTTLNAVQEERVIHLRTHPYLPLDDLLAVIHEFIESAMSRFVGVDLGRESDPDAATLLRFRRLLEEKGLTESVFSPS